MDTDTLFMKHMKEEVARARDKFPNVTNSMIGVAAEEFGEVAKALLKLTEDGELDRGDMNTRLQDVYDEAVQLAVTAMRLATEGDPSNKYPGTRCSYLGCSQPAMGGPCPLCYE